MSLPSKLTRWMGDAARILDSFAGSGIPRTGCLASQTVHSDVFSHSSRHSLMAHPEIAALGLKRVQIITVGNSIGTPQGPYKRWWAY